MAAHSLRENVFERVFQTRPWGQYPGEDVVRFVARHFFSTPDRSQVRLLEVGSGTGANLWFMAREGFSVHGIDAAPTGVAKSCERLDREVPGWRERGGQVQVGDFAQLPYPDGTFDAVLDVAAVCYAPWASARAVYAELARVTKPGGRLFSRTFAQGCWGEGTGCELAPHFWACTEGPLANLGGTRFTSPDDVSALCQGWGVERIGLEARRDSVEQPCVQQLIIQAVKLNENRVLSNTDGHNKL